MESSPYEDGGGGGGAILLGLHYLKSILKVDSFKEYINPMFFINLKDML